MKQIFTFIGGVAVGILTAIGICAMEEEREQIPCGSSSEAISNDTEEEGQEDGPGDQVPLVFRDFSDLS